jgi:hypothetical protein
VQNIANAIKSYVTGKNYKPSEMVDGVHEVFGVGYTQGQSEGYEQGHTNGYNSGKQDGQEQGYKEGIEITILKGLETYSNPTITSIGNSLFRDFTKLKSIDTPAVTTIGQYAFCGCSSLERADFPNVTSVDSYAFQNCTSMTYADLSSLGNIQVSVFEGCTNLVDIKLNTSKVKSVNNKAFNGCSSFNPTDDLFKNVTQLYSYAFQNCTSLKRIRFDHLEDTVNTYIFRGCTSLEEVIAPKLSRIYNYFFLECTSLSFLDLPKLSSFGTSALANSGLTNLVLRATTLASDWESRDPVGLSNVNVFANTPLSRGEGYIYVPELVYEKYKVKTNWTVFADQFRVLEEYTVDGTTTGEFDKSKI